MEQFPHLALVIKKKGSAVFTPPKGVAAETKTNRADRNGHSRKLQRWVDKVKSNWDQEFSERDENELAPLDKDVVPVFFQINSKLLLPTFDLETFGIEIISEEEDGYIIGASTDNFRSLESKIADFINSKRGSAKVADLWKIIDGHNSEWRPEYILSDELFKRWSIITDNDVLRLEVSIAFAKPLKRQPDETKRGGQKRLDKYRKLLEVRDEAMLERQTQFDTFIKHYGSIISSIIELEDSFSAQVQISGKGLKDLVKNYPFVFEVVEIEDTFINEIDGEELNLDQVEILAPINGAPIVGVIDSGIMEGHLYLSSAIDQGRSISYLENDPSTADHVRGGGHGTKVAGVVLFPNGISTLTTPYSPPCYIRNLRILDANNQLRDRYPADLMQRIVSENEDCKIYNLSVAATIPYRITHMSSWAAMIDKLTHSSDSLFVLSVGNIPFASVSEYLKRQDHYPSYLENPFCRIANPAQSSFGISVGSIDHVDFEDSDWRSLAGTGQVSGYSRIGHGIWGQIKPDLVEFGGGIVVSKNGLSKVATNSSTATELIHSTLHGGSAFSKSAVGTSFSAPKVTHIAAVLKKLYPQEGVNLIRALLVQGARLPGNFFYNPTQLSIKQLGFGLPSLDRVTRNSDHRVTFYSTNKIGASEGHIYSLRIPKSLSNPGNEYDILIEVTLAFTAKVRRTRQKLRSYLATWLDWTSSKLDQTSESFVEQALKPEEVPESEEGLESDNEESDAEGVIQWKIRERSNWGAIKGIYRNQGSLQKDWVILKSHQLGEELSFAVRGHKGWDKDSEQIPYAFTVSIEVLGAEIPIYEEIKVENQVEIEGIENEARV